MTRTRWWLTLLRIHMTQGRLLHFTPRTHLPVRLVNRSLASWLLNEGPNETRSMGPLAPPPVSRQPLNVYTARCTIRLGPFAILATTWPLQTTCVAVLLIPRRPQMTVLQREMFSPTPVITLLPSFPFPDKAGPPKSAGKYNNLSV